MKILFGLLMESTLLFLSDRNRSVDLWGSRMKDGKPVGAPFIIKRDLGWRTRIYDFTAGRETLSVYAGRS